jgi:hypothetical protein
MAVRMNATTLIMYLCFIYIAYFIFIMLAAYEYLNRGLPNKKERYSALFAVLYIAFYFDILRFA